MNLLIHIVAVPVFVLTTLGTLWSLVDGRWLSAVLLAIGPLVSLAAQGYGRRREVDPPLPFQGRADFVRRILSEQFVTFPFFVLKGGWARAVHDARSRLE